MEVLLEMTRAGEDLLVASADKPFRFPATFTFVVRSFTVLDGIGKGLDPRFDISEIAAPYARNLILEAKPQFAKLQQDFNKRLALQVRAHPRPPPPPHLAHVLCVAEWCVS
jgi:predicted unusual protein kinase regulating ubiquinone biosynthesis (AarF/ABC1/UbiB family)